MKAVAFSKFAFHAYLLKTVVAADSQRIPYQLPVCSTVVEAERATDLHPCCFPAPQRLETDLSYWMDQSRSRDQGRQHHYDENAPIEPGTTAPTDTEPMSTTTTINCDMKLSITKFSTAAFDSITDYILPTYFYRAMFKDSNNSFWGGAKLTFTR